MNKIIVSGIQYDPYEILGVTTNSSENDIKRAFNKRVKRYHPDKCPVEKLEDYTKKYNIVVKSYEFIKNKRSMYKRNESDNINNIKQSEKFDQEEFNKEFDKTHKNPNDFGYGSHQKITSLDDYKELDIKIAKQFEKFDNEEFNRMFEYLNVDKQNDTQSLVHKTNDNFYGYNTTGVGNYANVASYNGLMVCGDDYGQSGVGYWDSNYSDYKAVYKMPKHELDKQINVPDEFIRAPDAPKRDFESYKDSYNSFNYSHDISRLEAERVLMQSQINTMELEKEKNKEFIMEWHGFDKKTIEQGMAGELEKSASYLDILKKDYKMITKE